MSHEAAMLIIVLIALIAGLGWVTKGVTTRGPNIVNVFLQSSIRGVVSVGQTFVILTGGIDVSVGGIGLMCSVLGASMMTQDMFVNIVGHPVSIYIAMPVMLLTGLGWGSINGSLVSRISMPALIVTLAMWEITKGVGFAICEGRSLGQQPDNLAFIGGGTVGMVPVPVIIFVVVAVIAYFVLHHTTFGRSIYAVGGNPLSAWLSGINVKLLLFTVYIISGFLAGLAGIIITGRVMSASMRTLEGLELDSIAAVVVGGVSLAGGRGTIIGAILGVLIIGVINNGMSVLGADPTMMGIAKGVIIIGAVAADYIRRRQ